MGDTLALYSYIVMLRSNEVFRCIDDGTGRNLFYLGNKGTRTRHEPEGFTHEYFENGDQKYYYRGTCIRCRNKYIPVILSRSKGAEAYCLNICDECMLVTGQVSRLRGNGNQIYDKNIVTPKCFYANLVSRSMNMYRNEELQVRAEEAYLHVLKCAKLRRDAVRQYPCKTNAAAYNVLKGEYVSWGFGQSFDEYYGEVDSENQPNGYGVKFYSDGTIYVGGWWQGFQKTEDKGLWMRPDGSQYEGTWLQGRKHGTGRQTYTDDTVYTGQFANGFEHGNGVKTYRDGSVFEGRFRFGRRDGPGTLRLANGQIQKGNFRDQLVVNEKPPPAVFDGYVDKNDPQHPIYNPDSLLTTMLTRKDLFPPDKVQRRLGEHLKSMLGGTYLDVAAGISPAFDKAAKDIAFKVLPTISLDLVKMKFADMDAFLYFTGANKALTVLRLTTNKLESSAIESLGRKLPSKCWPNLHTLDLSFNFLDIRSINTLVQGCTALTSLTHLKLAGCGINAGLAHILASILIYDKHITNLDLSFNIIGSRGAEAIGNLIRENGTLTHLNLRSNNLGGLAIVNALKYNSSLRVVCLTDNKVGAEVISLLAARLRGTTTDLLTSLRAGETDVPELYHEDVYGGIPA